MGRLLPPSWGGICPCITLHKEAVPENSLPTEGTPRAGAGEEALESGREGRVSGHDRVHSVSDSRATQGLPTTPSVVVSSSVSLRQIVLCASRDLQATIPQQLGVALTPRTQDPFPKKIAKGTGHPRGTSVARHSAEKAFLLALG